MTVHSGRTTTQNTSGLLGTIRLFGERPNLMSKMVGGVSTTELGELQIVGNGWTEVRNREFPLTVDYDLPDPVQPTNLEGADAPTPLTFQPEQDRQVVQIHHAKVEATYLAAEEWGRFDPTGVLSNGGPDGFSYSGLPRTQLAGALAKINRDYNFTSWQGSYANPANPGANALQSRGILTGITTNVLNAGGATLSRDLVERLYEIMNVNSGVQPEVGLVIVVNPRQMRPLNNAFATEFRQGDNRMIGGLMTREFYTPFGVLRFAVQGAWDPDVPVDTLALINPLLIRGRFLPTKGEAVLVEPLARTGSADSWQLYGHLALDYGAEWRHGKITGLALPGSGS